MKSSAPRRPDPAAKPLALAADHARRFLVRRHLLDPPRSLPARPESVLAVVDRLGSLQFDPLETPGARNHDLVLFARIADYQRPWCDQWLYAPRGERRLFEAYNKSLNILPARELPYYRLAWDRAEARYSDKILKHHAATARAILDRLANEGPLSTAAFSKHHSAPIDWHWAPTAEGRAVLEALFETGRIGIHARAASRRTYDLIERLFPEDLLAQRATPKEAARHRLLSRHRGLGLLGPGGSSELTSGTGTAKDRAAIVDHLIADRVLIPATIEGVRGTRYLLADELPLLEATARPTAAPPAVTFLAPLDPLLWDRKLLKALFGFDYTWEVYVPEAKRRFGYYVLPILFGARLVGRIEPRRTGDDDALRIQGLWFEPGFDPLAEPGFIDALRDATRAYLRFTGAARAVWPRGRVGAALARAMKSG